MKVLELKRIIKETIEEMVLPEMARTKGTGSKIKITDSGEALMKQMIQTKEVPQGMTNNRLKVLKALYKSKQQGETSIQKSDIAAILGTTQQGVNSDYNWLRDEGYAEDTAYTSKVSSPKNPRQSVEDILGDLED